MPCSARRGGISWLDFRFYKVLGREPPARYRVIKPARVVVSRNSRALSCYKILPLASPPSQKGPGGALCGVLPCGNISLSPLGRNAPQGAEIGALWGLCPAGLLCLCHAAPYRESQPARRAAYSRGSGTFPPAGHCARVWPRALPCHETRRGEGAGHAAAGAGTSRCGGSRC